MIDRLAPIGPTPKNNSQAYWFAKGIFFLTVLISPTNLNEEADASVAPKKTVNCVSRMIMKNGEWGDEFG